jgi:hypothetical protein
VVTENKIVGMIGYEKEKPYKQQQPATKTSVFDPSTSMQTARCIM